MQPGPHISRTSGPAEHSALPVTLPLDSHSIKDSH